MTEIIKGIPGPVGKGHCSHSAFGDGDGRQHVRLRRLRIYDVASGYTSAFHLRPQFLFKCLETAYAQELQHGHAGLIEFRHILSFQPVQSAVSAVLGTQVGGTASVFRVLVNGDSICPRRQTSRKQGAEEHHFRHKKTRRTSSRNCDNAV